jgi:hypothetical protein
MGELGAQAALMRGIALVCRKDDVQLLLRTGNALIAIEIFQHQATPRIALESMPMLSVGLREGKHRRQEL